MVKCLQICVFLSAISVNLTNKTMRSKCNMKTILPPHFS